MLAAAIIEAQDSHKPNEIRVETNDFYRTLTVQYFAGPRFPHLMRVDNKSDSLAALLKSARH